MNNDHARLVNIQKHLVQLKSDNANERFTACEELRLSPEIPDFAREALKVVLDDSNPDVRDAAQRALDMHSYSTEEAATGVSATDKVSSDVSDLEKMYKSIRSWAIFSIVIGGLSLVSGSVLDPVWGIVLIVIGVMSWRIKIPQMFILYSVIMAWAAISNGLSVITGGSIWWLGLAILQVYLTFTILRDYRKYNRLILNENFDGNQSNEQISPDYLKKIINRFSISSFILAIVSSIIMSFTFLGCITVLLLSEGTAEYPETLFYIGMGAVNLAVFALGLSISVVVSKPNKRGMAIGSIVLSSIVLIGYLGTILLFTIIDSLPEEGISDMAAIASNIQYGYML